MSWVLKADSFRDMGTELFQWWQKKVFVSCILVLLEKIYWSSRVFCVKWERTVMNQKHLIWPQQRSRRRYCFSVCIPPHLDVDVERVVAWEGFRDSSGILLMELRLENTTSTFHRSYSTRIRFVGAYMITQYIPLMWTNFQKVNLSSFGKPLRNNNGNIRSEK